MSRLSNAPKEDRDRELQLKQMFLESGCGSDHLSEQKVGGTLPNLICILSGKLPSTIIIGAHYDHRLLGEGVADNWSGASLLPSLLESVTGLQLNHTLIFIAFSGDERGLLGSRSYVSHMSPEERASTQAMVNLDVLGLGPTEVWISHSDPHLVNALEATARSMNLAVSPMDIEKVATTDSESFAHKKIPSITVHSVTESTWADLRRGDDKLAAIKMTDYYNTYRLLAAYLAVLDAGLAADKAPPAEPH